jgi:hypothetical protein
LGDPATFYDITTTAAYNTAISVCIPYDAQLYADPSELRLLHYENNVWVDVTASFDTADHVICGRVNSLSPFVVAKETYVFSGFFVPMDNPPVVNTAKAGQAIPVKWRITDLDAVGITDPASFYGFNSYPVTCGSFVGNPMDTIDQYAVGNSGLQNLGNGYWQINWGTSKGYAGTCRVIQLTLKDGTAHKANFQFK